MELRWVIDNALNFAPHAAVIALALAAYAIFGRHWSLAVVSLLVVVVAGGSLGSSAMRCTSRSSRLARSSLLPRANATPRA